MSQARKQNPSRIKTPACYLVSLKYSPIHKVHCFALGNELHGSAGKKVIYILSSHYRWMVKLPYPAEMRFVGSSHNLLAVVFDCLRFLFFRWFTFLRLFGEGPPECIYFSNPHPLNIPLALLAKMRNRECQVIFHFHELQLYGAQAYTSRATAAYYKMVQLLQAFVLKLSDHCIVSSSHALGEFGRQFPRCRNKAHLVPLLFEDCKCSSPVARRYVTYIGHIAKQKGISRFFDIIAESVRQGCDYEFQIVTSGNIKHFLAMMNEDMRKRLHVINQRRISNELISYAARSSFLVWCVREAGMQSGVLPVAFMNGTPVIVTPLPGLTEYVEHGVTGWVIPFDASDDDIFHAFKSVKDRIALLSSECRRSYEDIFDSKNVARYYRWLTNENRIPISGQLRRTGLPEG